MSVAPTALQRSGFVAKLDAILDKLAEAQHNLLHSADAISAERWKTRPRRGGWCPAELIAHLIMVERAVVGKADRVVQHTPRKFPIFKRLHLPMMLVEARILKRKAPIEIDAELVEEKETTLAKLREVRERTLAFLEETRGRDLSKYRWPHPFLGSLNAYEWFQFVAAHEVRHEKQLREIAASLPKPIANLQN
jgi:hypothetical protein